MLKRNLIKRIISDVIYCANRQDTRSLTVIVDFANIYLTMPTPFRKRQFYERKKKYIVEFEDYLKGYLTNQIIEIEPPNGERSVSELNPICSLIERFFEVLKCYVEEKKGLKVFKSDMLKHWEKK